MFSEPFARRGPFTRQLVECKERAHSLEGLSSVRNGPIHSTGCRVNVTSVEYIGPAHSLDNLSAIWERARISNDIIQFMINREFRKFFIFGSMCGCQTVMEKKVAGFNNSVEWRGYFGWQAQILIAC